MMERKELLESKEYWLTKIQTELFGVVEEYLSKNKLNRTKFAQELKCTKGYVSQVLNGDYDNRISKFVELSLAVGKAPNIVFKDLDLLIKEDSENTHSAVFNTTFGVKSLEISVTSVTTVSIKDTLQNFNNNPIRNYDQINLQHSATQYNLVSGSPMSLPIVVNPGITNIESI